MVKIWPRNAGKGQQWEEGQEGRERGWKRRSKYRRGGEGGTGDLLFSGDLTRVAEEEDRRLLMPDSAGCFRFMEDVERLSTMRDEERQTREAGFTLEVGQKGWALGSK